MISIFFTRMDECYYEVRRYVKGISRCDVDNKQTTLCLSTAIRAEITYKTSKQPLDVRSYFFLFPDLSYRFFGSLAQFYRLTSKIKLLTDFSFGLIGVCDT